MGLNVAQIDQVTSPPATTTTTTPTGTDVEIEFPQEAEVIVVRSFGLQLSYGNFVVTTTSNSDIVTVVAVDAFPTEVTNIISSNLGSINDLVIPNAFIAAAGENSNAGKALSGPQRTSFATALTTAVQAASGGTVVVTVPSNTITVSPSS